MADPHWTQWHSRFHGALRAKQWLPRRSGVAIACSGGQDSLLLAQLITDLQPKWDWHLHLIHCDHQWRQDSQANAKFVMDWADARQLPATLCTLDRNDTSPKLPKTEASARQWRYEQLQTIAQQQNCDYLVTGHTATDRAETLLFNLLRGSGSKGLGSLTPQRTLPNGVCLTRPLLDWTRAETGAGCHALQLTPWEDSTNTDLHYSRNRLRHQIFPLLNQHFNPRSETVLARTADILQAESDYLDRQATDLLTQAALDDRHPPLQLNRTLLAQQPLALQRRSLYLWLNQHCDRALNFVAIEQVIPLLTGPNRSQTSPFPGGGLVRVQHNTLRWVFPQVAPPKPGNHP